MNKTLAFIQGYNDFQSDKSFSLNPYNYNDEDLKSSDWDAGWITAESEYYDSQSVWVESSSTFPPFKNYHKD